MEVCHSGHVAVAYNSNSCPMCNVIEERDDLKSKITDLEGEINDNR